MSALPRTLYHAALANDRETCRAFLEAGTDVDALEPFYGPGTALHAAAEQGHTELCRWLIQRGASVDVLNNRRETPLYLAAAKGKLEACAILVAAGADPNALQGNLYPCLYAAVIEGRNAAVSRLLVQAGASLESLTRNPEGKPTRNMDTPLQWAAWAGDADLAEFFIDHGAAIAEWDATGRTALHIAAERGHTEVAKLLVARGAVLDALDNYRRAPIHNAALEGQDPILAWLVETGADPAQADSFGLSPLHYTAVKGCVKACRVLLDAGVPVDARDHSGRTPLFRIVEHCRSTGDSSMCKRYLPLIELLLARGADPDASQNGDTALHVAAAHGLSDVVDILLKAGADPRTPNGLSKTPLELASGTLAPEAPRIRALLEKKLIDRTLIVSDQAQKQYSRPDFAL